MRDLKIGIIGGGVVGRALYHALNEYVREACVYDLEFVRRTHTLVYTLNSDLVFLCLPESALEPWFASLTEATSLQTCFVLRSTVPVGTTRRLARVHGVEQLAHSPEFLTERCALTDAAMPSRNIIGWGEERQRGEGTVAQKLERLYKARWPHVPVLTMTSDESEAVKLFQNGFFAVKVSFWNELRQMALALKLDWATVRDAILADGRIHPSHTQVPGPDGRCGFGGRCLPKDLNTLAGAGALAGAGMDLCAAALRRNEQDRLRGGS